MAFFAILYFLPADLVTKGKVSMLVSGRPKQQLSGNTWHGTGRFENIEASVKLKPMETFYSNDEGPTSRLLHQARKSLHEVILLSAHTF